MNTKLVWYYSCRCGNQAFTEVRRRATCTRCGPMQAEEIPLEEAQARLAQGRGKRPPGKAGRAGKGTKAEQTVQPTLFDAAEG